MKRGTPRHPKVGHLCELLKIKIPTAVGYLELLWHFTAEFAPQGDIGKFADARIEAGIHWSGRPGRLIAALVEAGFIDLIDPSSGPHRLLIHGWCDHADDAVRKRLNRAGLQFLSVAPKVTGHQRTSADIGCLPEPEPEPEPDTRASGDAQPCLPSVDDPPFGTWEPHRQTLSELQDEWFEEFWAIYWLKKGKIEARKAFGKHATSEAKKNRIIEAVKAQSAEMLSRPADKRKWAQGWLNSLRFEDDAQEYQRDSANGTPRPAPGPRAAYHRKWEPPIGDVSHA